jgi:hypothetical protein
LHTLFDRGYVTVTPEYHLEVSRRLRSDFDNGEESPSGTDDGYDCRRQPTSVRERNFSSGTTIFGTWAKLENSP